MEVSLESPIQLDVLSVIKKIFVKLSGKGDLFINTKKRGEKRGKIFFFFQNAIKYKDHVICVYVMQLFIRHVH